MLNKIGRLFIYIIGLASLLFLTSCGDANPYVQALGEPVHEDGYFWYVRHAPDYDYDALSCAQDICHGPDYVGGASSAPSCYDCHDGFPHDGDWKTGGHQAFVNLNTDAGCQTNDVCHNDPATRGAPGPFVCTSFCHQ